MEEDIYLIQLCIESKNIWRAIKINVEPFYVNRVCLFNKFIRMNICNKKRNV